MSLTKPRFDIAALQGAIGRPEATERRQSVRPEDWPDWVIAAVKVVRNKFAAPDDGRGQWTDADSTAYCKLLGSLGETLCDRVVWEARKRHHWRPSVAELQSLVDELRDRPAALPACDAKARTVVRRPLALPPHPDNPGRQRFREALGRMQRGQRPGPDTGMGGAA